jgi:ribosomal-protein-alanine N-acetyltransferase
MFQFQEITLKKLCRDDLQKLLDLKSESWATTHHATIANIEDQERWFDSLDQNVHTPRNLMLIAHSPKIVSSSFGVFKISEIDWVSRSCFAAWDVFREFRGKKLGRPLVAAGVAFCFRLLNLRRVNCEILATNIASKKCAESAGFQQEGLKRESVSKMGEYIDSEIYGVLSREFAALHGGPNQVE